MVDYLSLMIAIERVKFHFSNTISAIDIDKAREIESSFVNLDLLTLGTLYLHIFEHSGPSDIEIAYLEEASALWASVNDLYQRVEKVRMTAQQLPQTPPSPDKYNTLQSVLTAGKELEIIAKTILDKSQNLLDRLKPTDYLETHPNTSGSLVQNWSWHELLIGRRTGAFVSNLTQAAINLAPGNDEARAFAHGALIGYATHTLGSAYINDVVGGPRRNHPYRQKLARNTVGAWYRANFPTQTTSIAELRDLVTRLREKPTQVTLVEGLITNSLSITYPMLAIKPIPDISKAIDNMVHHLELLTSFLPLTLPPLNPISIQQEIENSGARGETDNQLKPATFNESYVAPPGYFTDNNPVKDNEWYEWLLFPCQVIGWILGKVVEVLNWLGVQLGLIDPSSPSASSQVQGLVTSKDYYVLLDLFARLQDSIYQNCADVLTALKLLGILYPDEIDLAEPPFRTFTVLRREVSKFHLPVNPHTKYLGYPQTSEELPLSLDSPFRYGNNPEIIFGPNSTLKPTVDSFALDLLVNNSPSELDPSLVNLNLDADRGFIAQCWELRSPVGVYPMLISLLNYNDI